MAAPEVDEHGLAAMRSVHFTGPDGQPVCAHHFGGQGDLLLIAHAAGFCGGAYAPLAAELRTRFDVWALDLRGHGDSPAPPDGDFSWDGMARDILTVVTGLGRGPAALFGHSLGGGAGLRAEALAPGTFFSAYVYEPAILPNVDGVGSLSNEMGALARQRRAEFPSRGDAITKLASRPPFETWCDEALRAFALHGLGFSGSAFTLKCAPENEAAVYEAPNKITVEQVADVSIPVSVGIGERENGLPALAAPLIISALADARLESYPGLGHLGPFEDPSWIAASAAKHLRSRASG